MRLSLRQQLAPILLDRRLALFSRQLVNVIPHRLFRLRPFALAPTHRDLRGVVQRLLAEPAGDRTLEQNAKMWAMLTDISRQVQWYGEKLTPENWKDMITAALKRQKVVHGIEGGFVALGQRTSKMSIKEMIDVIDFAYAFGADPDHPVKWTEPDPDIPEWCK